MPRGVRQGREGERVWAVGVGQEAGVVVGWARGMGPLALPFPGCDWRWVPESAGRPLSASRPGHLFTWPVLWVALGFSCWTPGQELNKYWLPDTGIKIMQEMKWERGQGPVLGFPCQGPPGVHSSLPGSFIPSSHGEWNGASCVSQQKLLGFSL